MSKKPLGLNVHEATRERIKIIFDNFHKIYLSFSGGKDSGVMFHLVAEEARARKRKIGILFIDLEGQYKITINYINKMFDEYKDIVKVYHVCLPIILRNAVSVYEPRWYCWEPGKDWVRELPSDIIYDQTYFPFFKFGMEFEEFVPEFGKWYSRGEKCACFVGIRTNESLNRFRAIANKKKQTFKNYCWTTKLFNTSVYNIYPLYDWKTKDIWIYNGKYKKLYNELYDLMHKAGLSIHQQRICQPYGDDQRKGLWLYQVIEPETWAKIVARVSGANSGKEFVQFNGSASGQVTITKPENKTWKEFTAIILESMPNKMKEHYSTKIFTYLRWYEERGYRQGIPDQNPNNIEDKKSPSWKRICKMLLRNDYWAKSLSFSQTKTGYFYKRYLERKKKEKMGHLKKVHPWSSLWF